MSLEKPWDDPLVILEVVSINVTNIVSANISPRVQKEIIGFIGKHRQYIGKIKNTKILKNIKKEKNHSIFEKIGKYRQKSANIVIKSANIAYIRKNWQISRSNRQISLYIRKNRQISRSNRKKIAKKSGKISGRYIADISPVS